MHGPYPPLLGTGEHSQEIYLKQYAYPSGLFLLCGTLFIEVLQI